MAKKRRKQPTIHHDKRGPYIWENYFVGGRQKRQKKRVTVIDGKVIEDTDAWLLANADDCFLHQCERWDLIAQREMNEQPTMSKQEALPPRSLPIAISDLELAFEFVTQNDPIFSEEPTPAYLDLTTGEIIYSDPDDDTAELWTDINLLRLPSDIYAALSHGELDRFVDSLPDDPLRSRLEAAIRGKGAYRRFKDIVFGEGNIELKYQWRWFETRRRRECIVDWLHSCNIQPQWDCDIFQAPPMPNKRADLLRAVLEFVQGASAIPGIRRIALMGSLATSKPIPKDVDLLIEVEDSAPLNQLARLSRQLFGKAMQTGDGCCADVFLCNPHGKYIGRICEWKKCAPGIRQSCRAQHCGRRQYLNDDLPNFTLQPSLVAEPALELWPKIVTRTELPEDVKTILVAPFTQ